tara:strand:+ start:2208 stop:5336 length:3129 start_codon:yes stop_codon:yes gene_type:complete
MAYQSFGSYGSFQFTPDLGRSRKILQAREQARQGEDRYLNQLQQQTRSYMEVMRQKLRDEQAQRDRNFKIEADFRQQVNAAENRNSEIDIANLEIQKRQSAQFLKSLSDFSQTLGKKFVEIAEEKEEKKALEERYAFRRKLEQSTPEELRNIFFLQQSDEAQLQARDSSLNAIANSVAAVEDDNAAEPIRQMAFGSLTVNEQRAYLSYIGANIGKIAEINKDFKLPVSVDGKVIELTLNEAKQKGGDVAVQAYQAFRNETIKQLGLDDTKKGLSEEFIYRNFTTPATQFIDQDLRASEAKRAEQNKLIAEHNAEKNMRYKLITAVSSPFDPESPHVISTLTANFAAVQGIKDHGYIRDTVVLPLITEMVEENSITPDQAKALLDNSLLTINDSGKPVALQSIKSSEALNEAYQTIKATQKKIDTDSEAQAKFNAIKDVRNLFSKARDEDGRTSPAEIAKIRKAIYATYRDRPDLRRVAMGEIDNFGLDQSENLDKEEQFHVLKEKALKGHLSALEVQQNSDWLDNEQKEELSPYVAAFSSSNPKTVGHTRNDFEKQMLKEMKSKASIEDIGKVYDPSIDRAVTASGDYYISKFDKCMSDKSDPDFCALDAFEEARTYVTNGINDPSNRFYIVEASESQNGQGFVRDFKAGNYTFGQGTVINEQIAEIRNNPNLLSTQVYLSNVYLDRVVNDIKNGRMIEYTPTLNQMAAASDMLPYQAMNEQLKARGDKERIMPGAFDKLIELSSVSPTLTEALRNRASLTNVNTAIIDTGNAVGTVRKGPDGAQDVMSLAQIAKFKAPPLAAAMWANETGWGDTVHGSNALFNVKSKTGEGTLVEDTPEYINEQWVTEDAVFENYDTPLQSAQALTEWVNNAPGFAEAKTYRQAIQAIQRSGYATDPQYESKILTILKGMGYDPDDLIQEYTGPQSRNPNRMSITGARVASALNTTAETPIIQAKQAEKIKQYVELGDPSVGMEKFSKIKAKFPELAIRKYSTPYNLGWGQVAPNGQMLHFKGGARVIGGYQTADGYKTIIGLPNGEFFSF